MIDLKSVSSESLIHIAPYVPELFRKIEPLLMTIDLEQLAEDSRATIHQEGRHPYLEVLIQPKRSDIPGVYLYAAEDRCSLGLFESEYIEDNHPDKNPTALVEEIFRVLSRYLAGVTVIDHFTQKGKLLRREGYFGLDPLPADSNKIGTSVYGWSFRKKSETIKEARFTFLKAPNQAL